MPITIGSLDSAGHPKIGIEVWGLSEQFARPFEAMIDTGFTGFLMLPFADAFPLALTLYGTANYTLADGATSPKLLAYGSIRIKGESSFQGGVIVLGGNAPLLGMDFLKRHDKALMVSKIGIALFDEADVLAVISKSPQSTPDKPEACVPGPSNPPATDS